MLKEVEWCNKKMKYKHFNKTMILTKDEEGISRTLINVTFVIKILCKRVRVRDHCHITGKYGGSADQDFNKL